MKSGCVSGWGSNQTVSHINSSLSSFSMSDDDLWVRTQATTTKRDEEIVVYLGTCEHDLAGYEDQEDDLRLDHAIDETRE